MAARDLLARDPAKHGRPARIAGEGGHGGGQGRRVARGDQQAGAAVGDQLRDAADSGGHRGSGGGQLTGEPVASGEAAQPDRQALTATRAWSAWASRPSPNNSTVARPRSSPAAVSRSSRPFSATRRPV